MNNYRKLPKHVLVGLALLLNSQHAYAETVEIFNNQTVTLSSLLTTQPDLKFSEIKFRGTFPADGNPSATLLIDQSKTFTATSGTADQQLWVDQSAFGPVSGKIMLASGTTLTVTGNDGSSTLGGAIRVGNVNGQNAFSLLAQDNTASYVFSSNVNAQSGGALHNRTESTTTIQNANFNGNTAQLGGAVSNAGSSTISFGIVNLENSNFSDNIAFGSSSTLGNNFGGGAIYNSTRAELNMQSVTFQGNQAVKGNSEHISNSVGGAIFNWGRVVGTDVEFSNNHATQRGGAIFQEQRSGQPVPSLTLTNVTFTNNSTGLLDSYQGGAIYSSGATVNITNGSFTGNSSGDGGAIFSTANSFTLTDSSFIKNTATDVGGAIYTTSPLTINVTANQTATFSGNTANGVANSIRIEGLNLVTVNTETGATLDMRDPFTTGNGASIVKTGAGTWKLGGASGSTVTGSRSYLEVNQGTLHLYGAGEVSNATTADALAQVGAGSITLNGYSSAFMQTPHQPSYFKLGTGATLVAGGVNSINIGFSPTVTGYIQLDNNSTVKGGSGNTEILLYAQRVLVGTTTGDKVNLSADAGDTLFFRAALQGPGGISKNGQGTVIMQGNREFEGSIDILEGTLAFQLASAFDVGGINIAAGATADFSSAAHTLSESFTVGLNGVSSGQVLAHAGQDFSTSSLTLDFGSLNVASFVDGTSWDVLEGAGASFVSVAMISEGQLLSMAFDSGSNSWIYDLGNDRGFLFSVATGGAQIGSLSSIPEPASFAALAGLLSLSLAHMRRRRALK